MYTDVCASVCYMKPSSSGHSQLASALHRTLSPPKTTGMEIPLGLHVFRSQDNLYDITYSSMSDLHNPCH